MIFKVFLKTFQVKRSQKELKISNKSQIKQKMFLYWLEKNTRPFGQLQVPII